MAATTKATTTNASGLRPFCGSGGAGATGASGAPQAGQFEGLGIGPGSGTGRPYPAPQIWHPCGSCCGVSCDISGVDMNSSLNYNAKRFKNDSQLEISVKRPITSRIPSAIITPPEKTSSACI